MRPQLLAGIAVALIAAAPSTACAQKQQRDLISREELVKVTQDNESMDLFTAIQRLRPRFLEAPRGLRSFGGGTIYPIVVSIDGRKTDPQMLQTLRALEVEEVRYLDPSRSQNEFGVTANSGAIVIKLPKKPKDPKPPKPPA